MATPELGFEGGTGVVTDDVDHQQHIIDDEEDEEEISISYEFDRSPSLPLKTRDETEKTRIAETTHFDDIFSVLSADILSVIFSSWLTISEISRLDRAACNRYTRARFLDSISSNMVTLNGSREKSYGNDYISWLISRNIKIKYFRGHRTRFMDGIEASFLTEDSRNFDCWENLEEVNFHDCHKVQKSTIISILGKCPGLKILNLAQLFLTDTDLSTISLSLPSLVSVNLSGNNKITDRSMIIVVRNCPLIHTLDLSFCNLLTEESFSIICSSLNLIYLDLTGCTNLEDSILLRLAPKLKNLKTLHLNYCHGFSILNVGIAIKKMVKLESLSLPILHIHIDDTNMFANKYIEFLRNVPLLKTLCILEEMMNSTDQLDRLINLSYPDLTILRPLVGV